MSTVGRLSAARHLAQRLSEVPLSNGVPHCGQCCVGFFDSMETQRTQVSGRLPHGCADESAVSGKPVSISYSGKFTREFDAKRAVLTAGG
jgi:hypothetical protein